MPDAGEIKAKVVIEADTSGADKAKQALQEIKDMAGSFGENAGGMGDSLAQLGEHAGNASEGVAQLAENASSLEKPMQAGQVVVTELTGALGEHQAAIEQAGESYKALAEPLGATVSMLQEAGPPMMAIAEHAQGVAEHLGPVGESFAQLGDSLNQSVPLLPTFAESMRVVDSTLVGSSQGFSNFHENMAVFADAMENPSPFSMINQHLNETGQTWGDFTSSIGSDNVQMLHEMASNADVTHQVLGGMASNAQSIGATFTESADSTKAFTEQFNALGAAATDVNTSIGETSVAIEGVGKTATGGGFGGFLSDAGGAFGGVFGGVMNGLNAVAMPLMAVQMIGMAVSSVGQGIYNAAAIAEGPAAHSFNSFTGQVDLLAQNSQKAGQAFSEAFGQNLLPSIKAINDVTGGNDFWGGVGGVLGGAASIALTAGELGIGGALAVTGQFNNPLLQMGIGSIQNEFGVGPQGTIPETPSQVYIAQQMPQIANNIAMMTAQSQVQSATILAEAATPGYLQSQDYAGAATQYLSRQQASYNASHPISQWQIAQDASYQAYADAQQLAYQNSPTYAQLAGQSAQQGNWGGFWQDIGAAFGIGQATNQSTGINAHPVGAPLGINNGLPFGINIGTGGISNPIPDWFNSIGNFFNGSGSGMMGDLFNQMLGGGEAHAATFGQVGGAGGAFGLGSSTPDSSGAINKTVPITVSWNLTGELEKTWQSVSNWNLTGELAKVWQSVSSWSLSGDLNKAWQAVSSWSVSGELNKLWQSVSSWDLSGELNKAWQAVSSWNLSGDLNKAWQAVSSWNIAGDLNKTWQAVSSWDLSGDLNKAWKSAVTWEADNLNPVFNASPIWNATNLNPVFQVAATFLGLPGFATGVENFSGGAAIVGEKGPELVTLPGGSSVYPMTTGPGVGSSIALGGGGTSGPVTIQLYVDSAMLAQQTLPQMAPIIRAQFGVRY